MRTVFVDVINHDEVVDYVLFTLKPAHFYIVQDNDVCTDHCYLLCTENSELLLVVNKLL